jgi:hypothetical protein
MSKTPDEVEQERHCRELLHRRVELPGCREQRRVPGDGQGGPLRMAAAARVGSACRLPVRARTVCRSMRSDGKCRGMASNLSIDCTWRRGAGQMGRPLP